LQQATFSFSFETLLSDFFYDPFPFLLKPCFQTSFIRPFSFPFEIPCVNVEALVQCAATSSQQRSAVNLRPTNNPLINAPKNSTQFIIDDHEESNLFWKFDAQPPRNRVEGLAAPLMAHGDLEDLSGGIDGGGPFYGIGDRCGITY
jgi:hypothetical protein